MKKNKDNSDNIITEISKDEIIERADILSSLSTFLSNIATLENNYRKKLSDIEAEIQDLLHEIELIDLSRSQRNVFSLRLQEVRRERRQIKDLLELLDPCSKIVKDSSKIVYLLSSTSNKIKEINDLQKKRVYTPRIKKMDVIAHKK